jgi:hypothetical protein
MVAEGVTIGSRVGRRHAIADNTKMTVVRIKIAIFLLLSGFTTLIINS